MFQINKSNTYLNGFNLYSKVTYEKLGRFKLVAWLLISFLAMVLQIVPSLLISFVIGAIIGVTAGGLTGSRYVVNLEEAVTEVQKICDAAKTVNPNIIILTHGGPFKDVETAQYSINHASAAGYASGSSGERIPTEEAVIDLTRAYKKMSVS